MEKSDKPMKTKKKKQHHQDMKGFFLRVPADLKSQLDIAANEQGISQARLAVDLISQGLNQSVDVQSMEVIEADPDQVDLESWLSRHG